jgi:hypothetical protein
MATYLDDNGNPTAPPASLKTKKDDAPKLGVKELKEKAQKMKPVVPPKGYVLSAPPDYTSNPKNEGLYEMYGRTGQGDAVGNLSVPFSKVKSYMDAGGTFAGNSGAQDRYEKDSSVVGKKPTLFQRIDTRINAALEPKKEDPNRPQTFTNLDRAAGRAIYGAPKYLVSLVQQLKVDHDTGTMEAMKMLDPAQLPAGLHEQWKADMATGNTKLAMDNLMGSLVGLGFVGAVTHGAEKLVGEHVNKLREKFTPVTEAPVRKRTNVVHRNPAGEVRQAKGQAPTVWLSPDSWRTFMGSLYPGEDAGATHGVNLPASEHLQAFASDPKLAEGNPAMGHVQELLAEAHKNASEGGVAIAKQRPSLQSNVNVMREELNHTWQRSLANGDVTGHLKPEAFDALHKAIPKGMQDHLVEQGYNGTSAPEMVTETAAKLMDGRPERFGVKPEEAVDFLDKYFKQVSDQHGTKALEELQHVRGIAADAKARAIGEHSSTGSGQDSGAIPSVATRGQGFASEGVPAFNREQEVKPTWYLKSERIIGDKMKGPQAGEDVHKMLISGGVKPEEMQWTGLDDFLKSKGKDKVTTDEIREHLANNNIQIKEVTKGEKHVFPSQKVQDAAKERLYKAKDALVSEHARKIRGTPEYDAIKKEFEDANAAMRTTVPGWGIPEEGTTTKYGSYQLPGGEPNSYREMLLTMPEQAISPDVMKSHQEWIDTLTKRRNALQSEADHILVEELETDAPYSNDNAKKIEDLNRQVRNTDMQIRSAKDKLPKPPSFKSPHWDEPNILAHVRMNDRLTPDGKRLLHVEELQSDMHQRGRDKGYTSDKIQKESFQKTKELYSQARDIIDAKVDRLGFDSMVEAMRNVETHPDWVDRWDARSSLTPEEISTVEEWKKAKEERDRVHGGNAVPDAPFKKTWHEMALRRIVKHAVDNGYDAVSWTPGADQNARYSLSNHVDELQYRRNDNGTYDIHGVKDGASVVSKKGLTDTELSENIGKDAASRIVEQSKPQDAKELGYTAKESKYGYDIYDPDGKRVASEVDANSPDAALEKQSKYMNTGTNQGKLEGAGLEVGGSGMKGFYDKIVPDYLNKFGKKFGSKVGTVDIPTAGGVKGSSDFWGEVRRTYDRAYSHGVDAYARFDKDGEFIGLSSDSEPDWNDPEGTKYIKVVDDKGKLLKDAPIPKDKDDTKTVQHLPITPEMRKSVAEEGVPLFNKEKTAEETHQDNWIHRGAEEYAKKSEIFASPNTESMGLVEAIQKTGDKNAAPIEERKEPVDVGRTGASHTTVPQRVERTVTVPLMTAMGVHPVVVTRVLPLAQLRAMAAQQNPSRQVGNVRDLITEARARMGNTVVP